MLYSLRDRRGGLLAVVLIAGIAAVGYAAQEWLWWVRCQPLAPELAWDRSAMVGLLLFVLECVLALPLALFLPRRIGLGMGVAIVLLFALLSLPGLLQVVTNNFVCSGDLVGG